MGVEVFGVDNNLDFMVREFGDFEEMGVCRSRKQIKILRRFEFGNEAPLTISFYFLKFNLWVCVGLVSFSLPSIWVFLGVLCWWVCYVGGGAVLL